MKTNIVDFLSFMGLHYGDTIDQVFDIYGAPDDEYMNPDNSYFVFYYEMFDEFVLNISFSSKTYKIESIFLGLYSSRTVIKFIEKFNIIEPKAKFIGNFLDEIHDYFGSPDKEDTTYAIYKEKNVEVEFFFPIDERLICRRIKVIWF